MPEQIINKIKKSILPQWKVCFISAMIMGLIAHLYKIGFLIGMDLFSDMMRKI